jgi:hypothetical protein
MCTENELHVEPKSAIPASLGVLSARLSELHHINRHKQLHMFTYTTHLPSNLFNDSIHNIAFSSTN